MNKQLTLSAKIFSFPCLIAGVLFLSNYVAQSQPATIKWFPQIKTAKDQQTLLLLNAGAKGFDLLRWQKSRTDLEGNRRPAMPILTALTPAGERLHDDPLPGFTDGAKEFRFALANDSVLFVVYEASNSAGTQTLFARRLNLENRKWSAAPQIIFTDLSTQAPAFSTAWYSRSDDGSHTCIYRMTGGRTYKIAAVVIDRDFKTLWQRSTELPPQSGRMALHQVRCTNTGAVLVNGQAFDPASKALGRPFESSPSVFMPDGDPLYRKKNWAAEAPPYTNGLFLIPGDSGKLADFYPNLGKKYTPSFETSEGPDGQLYSVGFYSNIDNEQVEGYFVYKIDPEKRQGELLKMSPLPRSVRAAFLREKAAAKRKPVPRLSLRWIDWTADGRPWILAEQQNFDLPSGQVESAVLLRMDSTYRIVNTRKVEKYQRLKAGDPQNFVSMAACTAPKNGWWLLWNVGNWPQAKIVLTECRSRGTPKDYTIDSSSRSNVSLLPQTMLWRDGKWYFVGESEFHERIRVGVLQTLEE